jgi:hypothetical protein
MCIRAQADWIFILPSELPAKELRHLPRKNAAARHCVLRSLISLHNEYRVYIYKLLGLSPKANYTDRATAAIGEVVPTFAGRRCYVVSATDSHGR